MYKQKLIDTHERIKEYIHRTPVLNSTLINNMASADIYFKCENFQRMGAFKMRGATNAILQLTEEQRSRGVVTHSSGNMAQAVSLAAKSLGIKAHIVMPENAPLVKQQAVADYGGNIILVESTAEARSAKAEELVRHLGASFIHPSNDLEVILGQGTAAKELLEDHDDLDYILTPVGGGGLVAGTSLSCQYFSDHCKTIGGEPMGADDAYRSLASGKIEKNDEVNTIADGLRTCLGDINFPIIMEYVDQIIRVEEDEIVHAMKMIWERMKIIVEPSCSVPLAAVLKQKEFFHGKKIGIILSGGNVDLARLPF